MGVYPSENFTDDEAAVLRPYFTNLDRPVFALVNLPDHGYGFANSDVRDTVRDIFQDFVTDPRMSA